MIIHPHDKNKLTETILEIPKKIPGISNVKTIVVDNNSENKSYEILMNAGADKILTDLKDNRSAAFTMGVKEAINAETDILITLDEKLQYTSKEVIPLIFPILNNQADVVIGSIFHPSKPSKSTKKQQKGFGLGSDKFISRLFSLILKEKISDISSEIRAYSKLALYNIAGLENKSYQEEVLIDLKFKGFSILEIPLPKKTRLKPQQTCRGYFQNIAKNFSIFSRSLILFRPGFSIFSIGIIFGISGIVGRLSNFDSLFDSTVSNILIMLGGVSLFFGILTMVMISRWRWEVSDFRKKIDSFAFEDNKKTN